MKDLEIKPCKIDDLPELPWSFESRNGDDPLVKKENDGWGCFGLFAESSIVMVTYGWDQTLQEPNETCQDFLNYLLASDEAKVVRERFCEEYGKR